MAKEAKGLIFYYAQEGLARTIVQICTKVLKKHPDESSLVFWSAFGSLREGSVNEALRQLRKIDGEEDIEFSCLTAQLHAHNLQEHGDQEAVQELNDRLDGAENRTSPKDLTSASAFLWLTDEDAFRALHLAERAVEEGGEEVPEAQSMLGWLTLIVQEYDEDEDETQERMDRAISHFDAALNLDGKDIDARMGKAKAAEMKEDYAFAENQLNALFGTHSWFTPALVEKARLAFVKGEWEAVVENCEGVLTANGRDFSAMRLLLTYYIAREGKARESKDMLERLLDAVDNQEPKNGRLCHQLALPLVQLSRGEKTVMLFAKALAERAKRRDSTNPTYLLTLGKCLRMNGEIKDALAAFNQASRLGEESGGSDEMGPLFGEVHCKILLGQLEEAKEQLDFLSEIEASTEGHSRVPFLQALMGQAKGDKDAQTIVKYYIKAIELHRKHMETLARDADFYCHLDIDLLLDCASGLLAIHGPDPKQGSQPVPRELQHAIRAMEIVLRNASTFTPALSLLARARYLRNEYDSALEAARLCLEMNSDDAEMHLLVAEVHLAKEDYSAVENALEQAVSRSFDIRNGPMYSKIKANILLYYKGEADEAIRLLENVLNQPGVRSGASSSSTTATSMTQAEKATLSLLLVEAYARAGRSKEASKLLKMAEKEFTGTNEELRVTITKCNFAIRKGDAEKAMEQLSSIPQDSPQYLRAKMALADVHLKQRNDKEAYAKTYQEIVELQPDETTYTLYGDALLAIQEPEEAVEAYDMALQMNPKNKSMASKIGKALVSAHDYKRAVDYYKKAVREHPQSKVSLLQELADLQSKLGREQEAVESVNAALEANKNRPEDESNALQEDVKVLKLKADIFGRLRDAEERIEALKEAYSAQRRLTGRTGTQGKEREEAAALCCAIAKEKDRKRQVQEAAEYYNEALKHDDKYLAALLALARMHMRAGDWDECEKRCSAALVAEPGNMEASMMLAELLYHKGNFETALVHLHRILETNPRNYLAMANLLHLLRCSGRLDDMSSTLNSSKSLDSRCEPEAGFAFCRGLEAKFNNRRSEALRNFNVARRDNQFRLLASYEMVKIYLQPELDALMENTAQRPGTGNPDAASQVLQSIRPNDARRHTILHQYVKMASGRQADVSSALEELSSLAREDAEDIRLLLAMAVGFLHQKQTTKARNQLKRINKMTHTTSEHDEFERAWLMLADIHIQGGKYDLAQDICKRCIKYNRSCSLAYEFLGNILELEQAYEDAAENYQTAWQYEREITPAIGYRLAFNHLKAKRYIPAINVCHKVLEHDPDYPQIREEILGKAQASLKP